MKSLTIIYTIYIASLILAYYLILKNIIKDFLYYFIDDVRGIIKRIRAAPRRCKKIDRIQIKKECKKWL